MVRGGRSCRPERQSGGEDAFELRISAAMAEGSTETMSAPITLNEQVAEHILQLSEPAWPCSPWLSPSWFAQGSLCDAERSLVIE